MKNHCLICQPIYLNVIDSTFLGVIISSQRVCPLPMYAVQFVWTHYHLVAKYLNFRAIISSIQIAFSNGSTLNPSVPFVDVQFVYQFKKSSFSLFFRFLSTPHPPRNQNSNNSLFQHFFLFFTFFRQK